MRMLRRGQIDVREAALIGNVSRQRVLVWCQNAGLDPAERRKEWLAPILDRMARLDKNPRK